MKKQLINYETLLKVTKAISHSKDPEEVALMTVDSIKTALDAKGCALFLINRKNNELQLATSYGLSDEYINKGPLSALRSIAQSLEDGPVAIYLEDVNFVQSLAQIAGMAINMARYTKGLKSSIDVLKTMRRSSDP